MELETNVTKGNHAEEVAYGTAINESGTAQVQSPHQRTLATHMTHHEQPFWLGRQRVYAEFSSPEDEDDVYEPGCCCLKNSSIEFLIFDHATRSLDISSDLEKVNNLKHVILRLPDRSTKPFRIYKESSTTDAAKCAPVFRAFRMKQRQQPQNMSYKDTVPINKLSWAGKFKIKTGRIQWVFFINLDRSLTGLSGKSMTSGTTASSA